MAVYTYGTGGSYTTPQAAVDALFVDIGTSEFTEIHYIRGMAGTYDVEAGEVYIVNLPVLVSTNFFPLLFDTSGIVKWRGTNKATNELIYTNGVPYIEINGISFIGQILHVVYNSNDAEDGITFENCTIGNIASPEDTDIVHLCNIDSVIQFTIIRCKIITEEKPIYLYDTDNNGSTIVTIINSVIQTLSEDCIVNKSGLVTVLIIIHSTLISNGAACYKDIRATPDGIFMYVLLNTILVTTNSTDATLSFTSVPGFVSSPLSSDYNCFNPALAGAIFSIANGASVYDLEDVQEGTNTNFNSFEADPLLETDWTLQADSPCVGSGAYIAGSDANGIPHTLQDIDIGAVQFSTNGYCTVKQVLSAMAVDPTDIGLDTDVERNAAIQSWIVEMTSLIDDFCGQSWTEATVPRSIANTCARMVANFIVGVVQRNKSPIVQVGTYTIQNAQDQIFTDDIKTALMQRYKKRPAMIGLGSLNPDEYDEYDEDDE